jgi:hypothetical protein
MSAVFNMQYHIYHMRRIRYRTFVAIVAWINAMSHLSYRYFIQRPFLSHLFIPWRRGGNHRNKDNDDGCRHGHNRGGYDAAEGRGGGGGGGGVVGPAIEGVRRRRPSPWPSPSSTSAVVDVGHRRGRRLVGHHSRRRPSSWPSPSSTLAVLDVSHRRGHRRVGHVVGGLWQKGEA